MPCFCIKTAKDTATPHPASEVFFREGFECLNADAKMAENGVRRGRKEDVEEVDVEYKMGRRRRGNFYSHM